MVIIYIMDISMNVIINVKNVFHLEMILLINVHNAKIILYLIIIIIIIVQLNVINIGEEMIIK